MIFNTRSRKLTIEPKEIEEGKHYLFVVSNISGQKDFDAVMMALLKGLEREKVRGLVVTKPITPIGADILAEHFHEQWVQQTRQVLDVYGEEILPAALLGEWRARWIPFADLPERDKNKYRDRVRRMVDATM